MSDPRIQRRQHQRMEIRISAELRTGDRAFTATTRDLSESGVGLEAAHPLTDGTEVAIGLFLVFDDVEDARLPPLWVKGRVAWCAESERSGFNMGLRFELITPDQVAWLRQVLAGIAQTPTAGS